MKKVAFLIHDLGQGGAEKVLVNLVSNMDRSLFDISVIVLFGGGVHEKSIPSDIRLIICHRKNIRGNSHLMKLLTPEQLYHTYVKDRYDILISFLEGPCARIVSGCDHPGTKTVSWIHCTMKDQNVFSEGFRSYREAVSCYSRMNLIVFVSRSVQDAFCQFFPGNCRQEVLYNTNESEKIIELSGESAAMCHDGNTIGWCGIGKLTWNKGFDRMIRIQKKLKEDNIAAHLYLLGDGEEMNHLQKLSADCGVSDQVTFLGFQKNPYKYLSRCDLYVCASHSEGFSTAATEALITGVPVCTVDVSGMKELLGSNNEWGLVTENDDEQLYQQIRELMLNRKMLAEYKKLAQIRGKAFSTETTVKAVQETLLSL